MENFNIHHAVSFFVHSKSVGCFGYIHLQAFIPSNIMARIQPSNANLSKIFLRLLTTEEIGFERNVSDSESSKSIEYFFCGVSSIMIFKMLH